MNREPNDSPSRRGSRQKARAVARRISRDMAMPLRWGQQIPRLGVVIHPTPPAPSFRRRADHPWPAAPRSTPLADMQAVMEETRGMGVPIAEAFPHGRFESPPSCWPVE